MMGVHYTYDVRVAVVADEGAFCRSLADSPPLSLLVVNGHGTATTLSLAERNLEASAFEERRLDISDGELSDCLMQLSSDAQIFLRSCSNGEGEAKQRNLANAVAAWAPGRDVFSATTSFAAHEIFIESLSPFSVRIQEFIDDLVFDQTYIACSQ